MLWENVMNVIKGAWRAIFGPHEYHPEDDDYLQQTDNKTAEQLARVERIEARLRRYGVDGETRYDD